MRCLGSSILLALVVAGCASAPVKPLGKSVPPRSNPRLEQLIEPVGRACIPKLLESMWKVHRTRIIETLAHPGKNESYPLYKTQIRTNNFLMAIERCKRWDLFDDFGFVLSHAFNDLFVRTYTDFSGREVAYNTWQETPDGPLGNRISVSQFLFEAMSYLRIAASLPSDVRLTKSGIQKMMGKRKVVTEHYRQLVLYDQTFAINFWPEKKLKLTHQQLLSLRTNADLAAQNNYYREKSAIHDFDLWMLAGTAELLAANQKSPEFFRLTTTERGILRGYVLDGLRFLRARLRTTSLLNFQGESVEGFVVNEGLWTTQRDFRHAGYTGTEFPDEDEEVPVTTVSWDITHARRLVQTLDSFYRHRELLGADFPTRDDMVRFANQYAYGIFNKNFEQPLFSNYFDGTNGWYRVGYEGREGYGFGPSDLSYAAMEGGFGFWAEFNDDISTINRVLLKLLMATELKDRHLAEHRSEHYGAFWSRKKRRWSLELEPGKSTAMLQFMPVLSVTKAASASAKDPDVVAGPES